MSCRTSKLEKSRTDTQMKITVEIPDPTPAPETESNDTVPVSTPEKAATPAPAPEVKVVSVPKAIPAPLPPPRSPMTAKQPSVNEEKSVQPSASYSSGNFAHQGGIMNVADPDKGNPRVFQFVQPKGDA